jgi:hypothetical protein
MANRKISELPTFTGSPIGTYLVMNNSSNAESFKITRESLLGSVLSAPVTGTWTLPSNSTNEYSFTVDLSASYMMSVIGTTSDGQGIIEWNAFVTLSNTNVPVIGVQRGWLNNTGNKLRFETIPDQIIGTPGTILNSSTILLVANVFKFTLTNNTDTSQVVTWSYLKIN